MASEHPDWIKAAAKRILPPPYYNHGLETIEAIIANEHAKAGCVPVKVVGRMKWRKFEDEEKGGE